MMRKISGTVSYYSTNGYISFENYTKVLNALQVTKICGDKVAENYLSELNAPNFQSATNQNNLQKIKTKIRAERYNEEELLVKQLWNKLNRYLFNYIDSVILVDVLYLLFLNNTKSGIKNFENYIKDINDLAKVNSEDQNKNFATNKVDHDWMTEEIFEKFKTYKPD